MRAPQLCAFVSAIFLSACVDLSAISDYAGSAKGIAGATGVAKRWQDSETMLTKNRMVGDICNLSRPGVDQPARDRSYDGIIQIHEVLASYFDALAQLASDRVPTPTSVATGELAKIKAANLTLDAKDISAIQSVAAVLTRALDAYRHVKVRDLMERTDGDVTRSLDVLVRLTAVYRDDLKSERDALRQWTEQCEAPTKDPAIAFVVRREEARILGPYKQSAEAIDQYEQALKQIETKHKEILAALKDDKKTLEETLKNLKAAKKELDAAKTAIESI